MIVYIVPKLHTTVLVEVNHKPDYQESKRVPLLLEEYPNMIGMVPAFACYEDAEAYADGKKIFSVIVAPYKASDKRGK